MSKSRLIVRTENSVRHKSVGSFVHYTSLSGTCEVGIGELRVRIIIKNVATLYFHNLCPSMNQAMSTDSMDSSWTKKRQSGRGGLYRAFNHISFLQPLDSNVRTDTNLFLNAVVVPVTS